MSELSIDTTVHFTHFLWHNLDSDAEFRHTLRMKLVEEAHEVAAAKGQDLVTELADVMEVLDAVLEVHRIRWDEVQAVQAVRRQERGGFTRRLTLLWTDDADP